MIERYAVYRATLGTSPGGQGAVLVVSDEAMNLNLDTVVVCPIGKLLHPRWPSRIRAMVDGREAEIAVDQIRTIAKARLGDRVDAVGDAAAAAVRHLITEMYGLLSLSS